jgi:Tfp pilus assembly protein FimT
MQTPRNAGFTLTELLVLVATIALLSAAAISASGDSWRRERLNAVAIDLAGWLDTIRRTSIRGNACLVTVSGGNLGGGATLATASQIVGAQAIANNCLARQPLQIGAPIDGSTTFTITPGGSTRFKFTPRGTVNAAAADTQLTGPVVIAISLAGSSGPLRCVRISEGLGLISIGSNDSSSGTCPDSSYGGPL